MPAQHSPAPALERARRKFRAAEFTAAADELRALLRERPADAASRCLLARCEMRLGRPTDAVALLAARQNAGGEAAMLQAVAFAQLGDPASARAHFRAASELIRAGDPLFAELVYQRAASHWIERNIERAEKELRRLPLDAPANISLAAGILRGAIASAGEHLAEQGGILLGALRSFGASVDDVYLYAMLVTQIAALAVELPGRELRDAAIAHVDGIAWTRDIGDLHFHAVRAIAWRHALEGDEFNAFRRLKQALSAARSDAWRVAALADRAYLAAALGEPRWAEQELRDAHELASRIDWNGVAGEEKLALPVLAELFAQRDTAVAMSYVSTFANVGKNFPRILSSRQDRRVDALQSYSLGRVQFALGNRSEAKRLLSSAWKIYTAMGIEWRAARAALALAGVEERTAWMERASKMLANYPRSWLARGEQRAPAAVPAGDAAPLTPAQTEVLTLLLEGRGTDDIARTLDRSTFTVRNHLKAIFKAYGVNSRAALIVKARRL